MFSSIENEHFEATFGNKQNSFVRSSVNGVGVSGCKMRSSSLSGYHRPWVMRFGEEMSGKPWKSGKSILLGLGVELTGRGRA